MPFTLVYLKVLVSASHFCSPISRRLMSKSLSDFYLMTFKSLSHEFMKTWMPSPGPLKIYSFDIHKSRVVLFGSHPLLKPTSLYPSVSSLVKFYPGNPTFPKSPAVASPPNFVKQADCSKSAPANYWSSQVLLKFDWLFGLRGLTSELFNSTMVTMN